MGSSCRTVLAALLALTSLVSAVSLKAPAAQQTDVDGTEEDPPAPEYKLKSGEFRLGKKARRWFKMTKHKMAQRAEDTLPSWMAPAIRRAWGVNEPAGPQVNAPHRATLSGRFGGGMGPTVQSEKMLKRRALWPSQKFTAPAVPAGAAPSGEVGFSGFATRAMNTVFGGKQQMAARVAAATKDGEVSDLRDVLAAKPASQSQPSSQGNVGTKSWPAGGLYKGPGYAFTGHAKLVPHYKQPRYVPGRMTKAVLVNTPKGGTFRLYDIVKTPFRELWHTADANKAANTCQQMYDAIYNVGFYTPTWQKKIVSTTGLDVISNFMVKFQDDLNVQGTCYKALQASTAGVGEFQERVGIRENALKWVIKDIEKYENNTWMLGLTLSTAGHMVSMCYHCAKTFREYHGVDLVTQAYKAHDDDPTTLMEVYQSMRGMACVDDDIRQDLVEAGVIQKGVEHIRKYQSGIREKVLPIMTCLTPFHHYRDEIMHQGYCSEVCKALKVDTTNLNVVVPALEFVRDFSKGSKLAMKLLDHDGVLEGTVAAMNANPVRDDGGNTDWPVHDVGAEVLYIYASSNLETRQKMVQLGAPKELVRIMEADPNHTPRHAVTLACMTLRLLAEDRLGWEAVHQAGAREHCGGEARFSPESGDPFVKRMKSKTLKEGLDKAIHEQEEAAKEVKELEDNSTTDNSAEAAASLAASRQRQDKAAEEVAKAYKESADMDEQLQKAEEAEKEEHDAQVARQQQEKAERDAKEEEEENAVPIMQLPHIPPPSTWKAPKWMERLGK